MLFDSSAKKRASSRSPVIGSSTPPQGATAHRSSRDVTSPAYSDSSSSPKSPVYKLKRDKTSVLSAGTNTRGAPRKSWSATEIHPAQSEGSGRHRIPDSPASPNCSPDGVRRNRRELPESPLSPDSSPVRVRQNRDQLPDTPLSPVSPRNYRSQLPNTPLSPVGPNSGRVGTPPHAKKIPTRLRPDPRPTEGSTQAKAPLTTSASEPSLSQSLLSSLPQEAATDKLNRLFSSPSEGSMPSHHSTAQKDPGTTHGGRPVFSSTQATDAQGKSSGPKVLFNSKKDKKRPLGPTRTPHAFTLHAGHKSKSGVASAERPGVAKPANREHRSKDNSVASVKDRKSYDPRKTCVALSAEGSRSGRGQHHNSRSPPSAGSSPHVSKSPASETGSCSMSTSGSGRDASGRSERDRHRSRERNRREAGADKDEGSRGHDQKSENKKTPPPEKSVRHQQKGEANKETNKVSRETREAHASDRVRDEARGNSGVIRPPWERKRGEAKTEKGRSCAAKRPTAERDARRGGRNERGKQSTADTDAHTGGGGDERGKRPTAERDARRGGRDERGSGPSSRKPSRSGGGDENRAVEKGPVGEGLCPTVVKDSRCEAEGRSPVGNAPSGVDEQATTQPATNANVRSAPEINAERSAALEKYQLYKTAESERHPPAKEPPSSQNMTKRRPPVEQAPSSGDAQTTTQPATGGNVHGASEKNSERTSALAESVDTGRRPPVKDPRSGAEIRRRSPAGDPRRAAEKKFERRSPAKDPRQGGEEKGRLPTADPRSGQNETKTQCSAKDLPSSDDEAKRRPPAEDPPGSLDVNRRRHPATDTQGSRKGTKQCPPAEDTSSSEEKKSRPPAENPRDGGGASNRPLSVDSGSNENGTPGEQSTPSLTQQLPNWIRTK